MTSVPAAVVSAYRANADAHTVTFVELDDLAHEPVARSHTVHDGELVLVRRVVGSALNVLYAFATDVGYCYETCTLALARNLY